LASGPEDHASVDPKHGVVRERLDEHPSAIGGIVSAQREQQVPIAARRRSGSRKRAAQRLGHVDRKHVVTEERREQR
jgi:hypothetical protein